MKVMKVAILASVVSLLGIVGCAPKETQTCVFQKQTKACNKPACVLRHVVLFKFQPTATPEQIQSVACAFSALQTKISEVKCFEWGTDVSPEGLSKGFTHAFVLTFNSEADRDAYLPHPAHKEFVAFIKPYVQEALVVDYWQAPGSSKCCAMCCAKCPMKGQAGCPMKDKAGCPMKDKACPKASAQGCPLKSQGCPKAQQQGCPLKK